jgi:IclR helix-turn-helix domain
MKRIIPIVGLGLGAGTSHCHRHDRRRRDDIRRDQNNRCSMTTAAGIFISAPHDGQSYDVGLGRHPTPPMNGN